MDGLMTAEQFCRIYYGLGEGEKPKQTQLNTVTQMCRNGYFKRAFKIGRRWLIDLDAEGVKK